MPWNTEGFTAKTPRATKETWPGADAKKVAEIKVPCFTPKAPAP